MLRHLAFNREVNTQKPSQPKRSESWLPGPDLPRRRQGQRSRQRRRRQSARRHDDRARVAARGIVEPCVGGDLGGPGSTSIPQSRTRSSSRCPARPCPTRRTSPRSPSGCGRHRRVDATHDRKRRDAAADVPPIGPRARLWSGPARLEVRRLAQPRRTELRKREQVRFRRRIAVVVASKPDGQRLRAHTNMDAHIVPEEGLVANAGLHLRLGPY